MEQVLAFLDSLQVDAADLELMLRALFQALLLGSSAVFSGSETDICHILTPGPRLKLLDADMDMAKILEAFRGYRHPRIPVYRGHWDNVVGFLHSEDVLRVLSSEIERSRVKLRDILHPAHFVPPTTKVGEMFNSFQAHNIRAAIVLGEFGEVLGIVAVYDVLSFLFGEITGTLKGADELVEDENGFLVPGYMRLMDFHDLTNIDIDDPVMATIGGMVFRLFGRLPAEGEIVQHEGCDFRFLEVEGFRIGRLRVSKSTQAEEAGKASPADPRDATPGTATGEDRADPPEVTVRSAEETRIDTPEEPQ